MRIDKTRFMKSHHVVGVASTLDEHELKQVDGLGVRFLTASHMGKDGVQ